MSDDAAFTRPDAGRQSAMAAPTAAVVRDPDAPLIAEPYVGYSAVPISSSVPGTQVEWDRTLLSGDIDAVNRFIGDRYHGGVYDPNGETTSDKDLQPGLPADPYHGYGYISKTSDQRTGYYTSFDVVTRDNIMMVVKDATFRDPVTGKFTGGDATILYDSNGDGMLDTALNFTAGQVSIMHPDGQRDGIPTEIPTDFANPMLERIHELAAAGRIRLEDTETLLAVAHRVVEQAGFAPMRAASPIFADGYASRGMNGQFTDGKAQLQIDLDGDGIKDAAITAQIKSGEGTFVKVTLADGRQGEIASRELAQSLILTTDEARKNSNFEAGEISSLQALAQRSIREAGLDKLPNLQMADAHERHTGQLASQSGGRAAGAALMR